ncbi:N-acetylmuramoyl-L-alanine amidase [Phreatobacter sp.]|uniref:N-acetylmuramoyl-L-alanine amidase n=1 Tax=Phreatobacter sp. TaxID=1966341 RepID=UPI003F715011
MIQRGRIGWLLAFVLLTNGPARAETPVDPPTTGSVPAVTAPGPSSGQRLAAASRSTLPAAVSAVRITGDARRTSLSLDLTRAVEMRAFALADPYRLIIDMDEVNFHLGAQAGSRGHGLVRAYRFGLFAPGKSRIVIDLSGPATIARATVAGADGAAPARLLVELAATDADGFRRANAARPTTNLARRGDRESLGPRIGSRAPAPIGPPLVVIDPGHGGIDSGAVAPSTGDEEKNIVLDFAKVLRDKLVASGRYRVLMTRDRDIFIPLAQRVKMARDAQAALFISVHADSISGAAENARGVTVYTLSDRASDADSERLAERENKADAIAGLDLSDEPSEIADILIDLTRRETRIYSANFARTLAGEMRQVTRMHRLPLRSAGFQVLRAHDIPSVLVELGFVSSRRDVEMLTSAIWRDRTADSVMKAVDRFFAPRTGVAAPTARN